MGNARSQLVEAEDLVQGRVRHDFCDERSVHGMPCALGDHMTEQGLADQGEVTDEIESLMAATLVWKPETAWVHDVLPIEADGAVEVRPADKAHVPHLIELPREAEGSSRRNFRSVALRRHFEFQNLPLDERMIEVDVTCQQETVGRQNTDSLLPSLYCDGSGHTQVAPSSPVDFQSGAADKIHKRLTAPIEDWDFEVVDLDECVVHSHAVENAQQVFGRRDQDALTHQAGRIAYTGHVLPTGGDLEILQIGANENDSCSRRSGQHPDPDWNPAMKSNALSFCRPLKRGLKSHENT